MPELDAAGNAATSPTGQLVGPSALWNNLPAPVQNIVAVLVFFAALLSPVLVAAPAAFPLWAKVIIASLSSMAGPLGVISAGVRK